MRDCVDYVTALLLSGDEPKILVGHSFSAQVAMAAASEQPEKVRAVILVGGMVPDSGDNFLTLLPLPMRLLMAVVLRLSRTGVTLPRAAVKREYCNDLDDATTQLVLDRVCPEAPRLYLDPVQWARIPAHVPVIYVKLLDDRSVSPSKQDEMIKRTRATRVETLESGHLPMLSRPREMAEILNRIAMQLA